MNEDEHGIRGQDDHGGPGWEEAMEAEGAKLAQFIACRRPWPLKRTGDSTVLQPFRNNPSVD